MTSHRLFKTRTRALIILLALVAEYIYLEGPAQTGNIGDKIKTDMLAEAIPDSCVSECPAITEENWIEITIKTPNEEFEFNL